jgi:hypothetical protein
MGGTLTRFSVIYGIRRFITAHKGPPLDAVLSETNSSSVLLSHNVKSILILSFYLHLDLFSDLFNSVLHDKNY